MNRDELKKMTDQVVRIRPEARRFDWNGDDLGPVDYHWRIAATGSDSLELEYLKRSLALPEPELLVVPPTSTTSSHTGRTPKPTGS